MREQVPGSDGLQISYETMAKLQRQLAGNVRELRNFIERAVLLADSGNIDTRFIGGTRSVEQSGLEEESPIRVMPSESTPVGAIRIDYNAL